MRRFSAQCYPVFYVRRKRTRRLNAFEELLPDSIDLVGRALRAGHPLTAGLKMAADEGSEPVAGEFRRVFEEQRFGLPLQDSLLGMADRVNLVDVRILVTAILIQREVGGNLAEILDNLAARGPRPIHHPPAAQGLHRPGPDDRLPPVALPMIMFFDLSTC